MDTLYMYFNDECIFLYLTSSVVSWSEFLDTDREVPGYIPGATRFPE
jgi:hypothetical protein